MHRSTLLAAAVAGVLTPALATTAPAMADSSTLFVRSAVEHPDATVTLPLHRGTSAGRTVWYVVLDASDGAAADRYGVNVSQKLANARGTEAVQRGAVRNGAIDFPASVDFSPRHAVVAGDPAPFPPATATPGAVGEAGYSPLVQLPDGTVLNAPQVARDQNGDGVLQPGTEVADKVVALDPTRGTVRYRETHGFARGDAVRYVSTDASDPLAAALEDATLAPALDDAPFAGGDGTDSSRATLDAFVNGATGAGNPQRQGLNSAVADGLDPLNVLAWTPNQGRYSPLWDVHLTEWRVPAAARLQTRVADVEDLAEAGVVTGPGGSPFGASGIVVDCPIIARAAG